MYFLFRNINRLANCAYILKLCIPCYGVTLQQSVIITIAVLVKKCNILIATINHTCQPKISNCKYQTPNEAKKLVSIAGINFRCVPKL